MAKRATGHRSPRAGYGQAPVAQGRSRPLKAARRHTLAALFIQAQLQKALDDVAGIFIEVMRKLESLAGTRLHQYQPAPADAPEDVVSQFRDALHVQQDDSIAGIFRPQRVGAKALPAPKRQRVGLYEPR